MTTERIEATANHQASEAGTQRSQGGQNERSIPTTYRPNHEA